MTEDHLVGADQDLVVVMEGDRGSWDPVPSESCGVQRHLDLVGAVEAVLVVPYDVLYATSDEAGHPYHPWGPPFRSSQNPYHRAQTYQASQTCSLVA